MLPYPRATSAPGSARAPCEVRRRLPGFTLRRTRSGCRVYITSDLSASELRPSPFEHVVVELLERGVRSPAAGYDLFRPVQVVHSPRKIPRRRRSVGYILHVGDLVGQF